MINLSRRELLTASAGALAAELLYNTASGPAQWLARAASRAAGDRVIVILQLTGGNDGLNTCIPIEDDRYYRARPSLAIGKGASVKLTKELGLHPSMSGLRDLWDRGEMAIINNVGYPQPDRSHFRSMEIWHTARLDDIAPSVGWVGRTADACAHTLQKKEGFAPATHVGSTEQPLSLLSEGVIIPSIVDIERSALKSIDLTKTENLLDSLALKKRGGLSGWLAEEARDAYGFSRKLRNISNNRKKNKYPPSALGRKLATVSTLMEAGLTSRIYHIEADGFDTHAGQAEAHAFLLEEVASGAAAFFNDLRERGSAENVTLMVFSEFGRRVRENASAGTDHGAAGPMLLFGGGVKGGSHGGAPDLENLDDGDVTMKIDFRSVYASVLEHWLQLPAKEILGGSFETLSLFKT
ncbi:MAG: DUF1501 domain-containing protein [Planctomycetota bacterium]